jgi:hypothetical protein
MQVQALLNAVIVRYLCKIGYPGEYWIAHFVQGQRLGSPAFFEQRRVPPYHQSQYRLADRAFERTDVMPFDERFNRRQRSLYTAGGAQR